MTHWFETAAARCVELNRLQNRTGLQRFSEQDLAAIEEQAQVALPEQYRDFLMRIGLGPDLLDPSCLHESRNSLEIVGDPKQPFPHAATWSLVERFLDQNALDGVEDGSTEMDEIYDQAHEEASDALREDPSLMATDGLFPIADFSTDVLAIVVTGPQRGNVWIASMSDFSISPVAYDWPTPSGFCRWYAEYISGQLSHHSS